MRSALKDTRLATAAGIFAMARAARVNTELPRRRYDRRQCPHWGSVDGSAPILPTIFTTRGRAIAIGCGRNLRWRGSITALSSALHSRPARFNPRANAAPRWIALAQYVGVALRLTTLYARTISTSAVVAVRIH